MNAFRCDDCGAFSVQPPTRTAAVEIMDSPATSISSRFIVSIELQRTGNYIVPDLCDKCFKQEVLDSLRFLPD